MKKIKLKNLSKYKKQFSFIALLIFIISVPLAVFFVQKQVFFRLEAAPEVDLFFDPPSSELPPNSNVSLALDANTNQIGFIATEVNFNPSLVKLDSEVQIVSNLTTIVELTTASEANNTGVITIVIALPPEHISSPPTGIFEFARLNFTPNTLISTQAQLSFNSQNTQIVNLAQLELSPTYSTSVLSLNSQAAIDGEIKLVTNNTNLNIGSVVPVNIAINTANQSISAISARITAQVNSSNPELLVSDNTVNLNSELLQTGNWSFPVNSITQENGQIIIDLSAINSSTSGYSNNQFINLGTFYLEGLAESSSPIPFSFELTLTQMLNRNDPPQNILAEPSSLNFTVIQQNSTLNNFRLSMQGVSVPGITRSAILYFGNTQYHANFTSEVAGVFSISNELNLEKLPVNPTGADYSVYVSSPGYLRKSFGVMTIVPGLNIPPSTWSSQKLIAGDFNADNKLNIMDIGLILGVYTQLSVPVSESNSIYDVDANNVITISDIAILLSNYTALEIYGD